MGDLKIRILIENGKIIGAAGGSKPGAGILVEDGSIKEIGKDIKASGKDIEVIDAGGMIVVPGLVDMHVHLRDPGYEDRETIQSGARAALKGGITSICCMPNTKPVADSQQVIKYIIEKASDTGCNIYPVAAMTRGLEGAEITEMGLLKEAGAVGFSDDGKALSDGKLAFEIMRYSRQFGLPLILHEEVGSFSGSGMVHEGEYSAVLGLEGISHLSDDLMIGRDIMLAKKTGARIHITHLSTAGGVEMIREAKKEGINVTCDVTAHHLFFNDSVLGSFDTNFKVKPPIRSEADRAALVGGIKDGTIDAIISDHAPHLDTGKNTTFRLAEFGTTGLETLFGASHTILCLREKMDIEKVIPLLTSGPAGILGIEAGKIEIGRRADIAVIDLEAEGKTTKESFISASRNSAFIGQKLQGEIIYTISNGKIEYRGK